MTWHHHICIKMATEIAKSDEIYRFVQSKKKKVMPLLGRTSLLCHNLQFMALTTKDL